MFNCILKTRKFLFPWTQIWKTAVDMNFKFFVEATIYEPIIMLMPLRDDVIKKKKILFVWMLNASVYLINCCWHEFQVFYGSNHLRSSFCVSWLHGKNPVFQLASQLMLCKLLPCEPHVYGNCEIDNSRVTIFFHS